MRQWTRRDALRTGLFVTAGLAGCDAAPQNGGDGGGESGGGGGGSDTTDGGGETPRVGVERVADGFRSPVDVAFGGSHTFVVDQPGRVFLARDGGREIALDLRDRVVDVGGYDERGLLGVALHPDFETNGRAFLRYSAPPRAGTPADFDHTFVLSEFAADPETGEMDADTERTLLELPEPQANHNAGSVTFGPDGYLYVGTGDGGGSNDAGRGHVDDWYGENAGGNGQDVTGNLLGSVLRIDVDENRDVDAEEGQAYGIPDDNPLVEREGRDEQFAWGFRNPWRMGFSDGTLYVADVGQNLYEEVNRVESGGNYGWNVREGTHCFSTGSPSSPPSSCPGETPDGDPLVDPVIEYPHGDAAVSGLAVIGGYVYHGDALPGLDGTYVFGDWRAAGRLFAATPADEGRWSVEEVPVLDGTFGRYLLAFGRDDGGDLYALTSNRSGIEGNTGALWRLTPP